ncbi:hypothetical protein LCGC14_1723980 [marine sediment metagenome]|uniref:Uncharacterized protein n=1 Tax=marine sediment metagenome TaxID=412755 RepID=A0A0F9JS42_9ZZZZ
MNKQIILKELDRQDRLLTFYKWKIIWNWDGWNPLGIKDLEAHKGVIKE